MVLCCFADVNPICNLPYFGAVLAIVLKNSSLIRVTIFSRRATEKLTH